MSSRRRFLKSISMLIASGPAIATSIEVKNISNFVPKKYEIKRFTAFKLTPELAADKEGLNFTINRFAIEGRIDIKKPFNYQIGYVNDDFITNKLTCIITQFQDEKGNAQV